MRSDGVAAGSEAMAPHLVTHDSRTEHDKWFSTRRRVAWSETDPSDAYTFASAVTYAEDTEVAWLRAKDLLRVLYPHLPRLYASVRFLNPLRFDEELTTRLALTRLGRTSLHYVFRLERESTLCAVGKLGVVYLSTTSGPAPLPAEVVGALSCEVLAPSDQMRSEVERYLK